MVEQDLVTFQQSLEELVAREEIPRALRPMTIEDNEDEGLQEQQSFDWEQSWNDNSDVNAYFTTSGDNPVVEDIAQTNDSNGRNFQELSPLKSFYSTSREWNHEKWAPQHRNYLRWMCAIHDAKNDPERLREGYKKFWAKWWQLNPGDRHKWLWKKQINNVAVAFAECGLMTKKQQAEKR